MKKLLIGLVAIVVLIVVVAIAAPFFVPVDTYKNQLIARVKAATGRDLKIAGPVKFSLLPVLGIEASQVSFSNAPGASTPDMVQLGKLEARLKVFPLLSGQLAIDEFVLRDPVILLEIDKQGRGNWSFGTAQPAAATPAPPAPSGGGARMSLNELQLDDIRVINGKLSYFDQRTGQKQELSDVNMKLSLPNLDSQFSSDGSITWRGKAVKTTVTVAKPRAVMDGGTSDVTIKVASEPVNFDFKGKLTNSAPVKVEGADRSRHPVGAQAGGLDRQSDSDGRQQHVRTDGDQGQLGDGRREDRLQRRPAVIRRHQGEGCVCVRRHRRQAPICRASSMSTSSTSIRIWGPRAVRRGLRSRRRRRAARPMPAGATIRSTRPACAPPTPISRSASAAFRCARSRSARARSAFS